MEILNIFEATWHFQIHRGFVIIHEEMKEKEMSPFEGLDDKGTCPPQLSTHSINSPSTNTKYLHVLEIFLWDSFLCIKERLISTEL